MKNYLWLPMLCLLLISTSYSMQAAQKQSTEQLTTLLQQHQGKVIYLDFWASWCGPCRKSFPWMKKMQSKYQEQGLVVISVNLDVEKELADKFLKDNPVNFIVVYDPTGDIATNYQIMGMPSSYIIDRDGELKVTHVGFFTKKKPRYEAQIQALLAQE